MTRPYYQEPGVTIYHGDCREILPRLQPVSAIVTDPPYGETSLNWDKQVRGWMDAAEAVTKSLWCFGSLQFFMEMARTGECARWTRAQEIVWEKHNGSNFHADRFKRVHELAVHFYRGEWAEVFKLPVTTTDATARTVRRKARPTHTGNIEGHRYTSFDGGPRLMRSVIYARSCHGEAEHPTQKPTAIIAPLLQYSVPAGGTVADCFMGSGSVLVAAKLAQIEAVGIDTDEGCCETAARRCSQGVLSLAAAAFVPDYKEQL